jgi:transcriptional regulator with XRE-family HTH domain
MLRRGWEDKDLAAAAGVSKMTVSRFLRRLVQTVKTARRLSSALDKGPAHYLVSSRRQRVAVSRRVDQAERRAS